ncbi:undecaprenyl-diphosphate phosphatase [Amycolatopsis sp. SID8362]|uniref:undecaprenyl-diphosphate phosphatase n=1 Tax=Amycolatopsis sp. SID8362 TaxID=2690346 RepID=UPI00136B03D3|nr:undecaprenyl-diphosphate phosphatase [Amycolatopsis sp. SID8362]NBH03678.1 undecaprenyl-diphosphate phosphatase [Amycolatopsis sp. SID8362]NED40379.1 undecaprenyl-diphosphate phosphatase [Amycolatopsis sp. SID8362]
MGWFEALVLGLVQGLTEFLPISSSAHLRIVAALAGWDDPGAAFTAVTQIGTELAVILYFGPKIGKILRAWFFSLYKAEWRRDPDARLGWLIIVGSLPIVVLGLLLQDQIDSAFRDLRITASVLIVFGLILLLADRIGKQERTLDHLTVPHGLGFGFAQALALIPGVSRSGGTTSAGLLLGYTRAEAAEYSFLLALPAVFGSGVYKLKDIGSGEVPAQWGPTILATLVAFGVGYVVIAWLMAYIKKRSFVPFVVYRLVLGVLLFVLIFTGALDPNAGPVGH